MDQTLKANVREVGAGTFLQGSGAANAWATTRPSLIRQPAFSPDTRVPFSPAAPRVLAAASPPSAWAVLGQALSSVWQIIRKFISRLFVVEAPNSAVAPVNAFPAPSALPTLPASPPRLAPIPLPAPLPSPAPPAPLPSPAAQPPGVQPSANPTLSPAGQLAAADARRGERKVFAHYMPWFSGGSHAKHWSFGGHNPSRLNANGLADIAAAHHPLIGAYDTDDDAVLGYHMLLMKAGGYDGASASIYGQGSPEDRTMRAMLAKCDQWAAQYNFDFSLQLMPDADPYKGLPADEKVRRLTIDVKAIVLDYARSSRYQRLEGKPVVYFFPKPDPSTGETTITPAMWAQVKANVGVPFDLVDESSSSAMAGVADGGYGWVQLGKTPQDYNPDYLRWLYGQFGQQQRQDPSPAVQVGVVYPGFDDVGVHAWTNDPNARRQMDRQIGGEATLQRTWDELNGYNASHGDTPINWVLTSTWNDWNEGTEIEPSVEEGDAQLQLAARNNAAFKGIQAPPPAAFAFAGRYLALRHAGHTDAELGGAIASFSCGQYDRALALLPVA
jgi:hypothetical protein